jgi:hypothetical protein
VSAIHLAPLSDTVESDRANRGVWVSIPTEVLIHDSTLFEG